MPIPTKQEVYDIFHNFSQPPTGTKKFFDDHVDDNVDWIVTGNYRISGRWTSKEAYWNDTWANILNVIAAPGSTIVVPGGLAGVIGPDLETGWAAVELKTQNTFTRSGEPYNQHFSWHVRFNDAGKIVEAKAWLDSVHLEKVLGGELAKQAAAKEAAAKEAAEKQAAV